MFLESIIGITFERDYYSRRGEWNDAMYHIFIARNVVGFDIIKINWK